MRSLPLSSALFLALLPTVAVAQDAPPGGWMAGTSCTMGGCCTRGHLQNGSWCVQRTQQTVLTPDATAATKVRYIQEHLEEVKAKPLGVPAGTLLWGFADAEGKTLCAPRYIDVVAESSTVLLTRDAANHYTVQVSGQPNRPVDWTGVETVALPGGIPVRFAVVGSGLAPIQLDGNVGATIEGASCANGGCSAQGNLARVKGSSGTVLVDVTGKVVKKGDTATVYTGSQVKQETVK